VNITLALGLLIILNMFACRQQNISPPNDSTKTLIRHFVRNFFQKDLPYRIKTKGEFVEQVGLEFAKLDIAN
jgi:hypothetical protein